MDEKIKRPFALKILVVASILLLAGLITLPLFAGEHSFKALGVLLLLYTLSVFYAMTQTFFKRFTPKDFDTYLTNKADEAKNNKEYKSFLLLTSITPLVTVGLAVVTLMIIVMIFVL